ncbi:LOG family protein [Pectobacterium carotovorum subsp. carotovorum]|nr:Lysine decarboxylase family protein [Pectobacterium atrosepticum]POW29840.1 LOG family protein [Pectobacterium atrosepticum]GKV86194.1 LOG family protein [Pectobacterium carotovorum subsp. carotovorum]
MDRSLGSQHGIANYIAFQGAKLITHISPLGSMDLLSQLEVDMLKSTASSDLYRLFRNCSLAVLNSGSQTDNSKELLSRYEDFDINVLRRERGVKLELVNPPEDAFVDGNIIRALQANLFAVLRDILFVNGQIASAGRYQNLNLENSAHITNLVFSILRNAKALHVGEEPNMVVCWGGHSINEIEYLYARKVGSQLGLRELNICTGCGPGAMEAPMKGAAVGHAQQRYKEGRFIGMTEPSIIAAEPPNPLVNELIIMPDIEKRLEAFVRIGHGIIIFPGGVGTAEEFLYLLGIMMNPENSEQVLPIILTGPEESADYFHVLDEFIVGTLGRQARRYYSIIIDDAAEVARQMKKAMPLVKESRRHTGDAYSFNWSLRIAPDLQLPFEPSHENMADLNLHPNQPAEELAAALRRAFSGIVAGNVKEVGIQAIEQRGPYKIHGDPQMMKSMDTLLQGFVAQQRMKLPGSAYIPCYEICS